MRKYRLVLILRSDIKKESKAKLLKEASSWGGKSEEKDIKELGEKKFAYPINGNLKGDYVVVEFDGLVNSRDIEAKVRVNDDVLRHMLVKI